jgi:hypothetical protein
MSTTGSKSGIFSCKTEEDMEDEVSISFKVITNQK